MTGQSGFQRSCLSARLGCGGFHQTDARILLAVGHRRSQFGHRAVFAAHLREAGHLIHHVDDFAAVLFLSQAHFGRIVEVDLLADEEHALVSLVAEIAVGLLAQVLVVELAVGAAQLPLGVVAPLRVERRRQDEAVVTGGFDVEIDIGRIVVEILEIPAPLDLRVLRRTFQIASCEESLSNVWGPYHVSSSS